MSTVKVTPDTTTFVLIDSDTSEFYITCRACEKCRGYNPKIMPLQFNNITDSMIWLKRLRIMSRNYVPRRAGKNHCIHVPDFLANAFPMVFRNRPRSS